MSSTADQLIDSAQPEDEKVSTDELQETIAEFDEWVQSTDIAAMQSEFTLCWTFEWLIDVMCRTLKKQLHT